MADPRARQPFRFSSCMELREIMGKRAMDEQRLLEIIEEAPPDSIYCHTHSYYLRHPYTQRLFPNDFATWAALHAQDRILGERLGILDPFEFGDIEELRREIVAIITDHLSHPDAVPRCTPGEPFEFVRSHVIEADLDQEAWTLRQFREALASVEVGAIYNLSRPRSSTFVPSAASGSGGATSMFRPPSGRSGSFSIPTWSVTMRRFSRCPSSPSACPFRSSWSTPRSTR